MRHSMRLATFLIGLWLGGMVVLVLTVPNNFRAVDSVLREPDTDARELTSKLSPEDNRMLLRHAASQANRRLFFLWGYLQVVLGGTLLGYLLFGTTTGRFSLAVSGVMLVLAAVMAGWLIPRIAATSRVLDFDRSAMDGPVGEQFQLLHLIFGVCEGMIAVLGLVLLGRFLYHVRVHRDVHRTEI